MSYLAPASFHFVRGIIKITKGSVSNESCKLRGSCVRNVASKIYYHKTCLSKRSIKNLIYSIRIILVMGYYKIWKLKSDRDLKDF